MVDQDLEKRAEELRSIAARLRRLAQQTLSPDPRRELLDLATRFESMAGLINDREPPSGEHG